VTVRIGLDGLLRIFHREQLVIDYRLRSGSGQTIAAAGVHKSLWDAVGGEPVQQRPLAVYEEVAAWNSTAC